MTALFYAAAAVAVAGAVLAVTGRHAVHALLCLLAGLLGLALAIFALGAPFAAALEVIIYAGAIMMLFLFVIMMMRFDREAVQRESDWHPWSGWIAPGTLGLVLMAVWIGMLRRVPDAGSVGAAIPPQRVGESLFRFYVVGVELASLLLLAGLVGAFHLARRDGAGGQGGEPPNAEGEDLP
jgi:NADH-quinone oxidoreductase subunit J